MDHKLFRLGPNLGNIKCYSSIYAYICKILSEYFNYSKHRYYNLYHLNCLKNYSILYEVPKFEVILPKSKTININICDNSRDPIKIGEKGIIYLTTDYNDSERNIFNTSDIEEKTKFKTILYNHILSLIIYCRLWKPNNEN